MISYRQADYEDFVEQDIQAEEARRREEYNTLNRGRTPRVEFRYNGEKKELYLVEAPGGMLTIQQTRKVIKESGEYEVKSFGGTIMNIEPEYLSITIERLSRLIGDNLKMKGLTPRIQGQNEGMGTGRMTYTIMYRL